jgi:quinol monooxygenase YgiN
MSDLVIVATIKTVPGKRDHYVKELVAHGERCRKTEPGTLKFEVLVPHDSDDTVMLYEVYTDEAAFKAHMAGESIEIVKRNTAGMQIGLSGTLCTRAE